MAHRRIRAGATLTTIGPIRTPIKQPSPSVIPCLTATVWVTFALLPRLLLLWGMSFSGHAGHLPLDLLTRVVWALRLSPCSRPVPGLLDDDAEQEYTDEAADGDQAFRHGPGLQVCPMLVPAAGSSEKADWIPTFVDYLYLSTTNCSAFGPTDTMPLTGRDVVARARRPPSSARWSPHYGRRPDPDRFLPGPASDQRGD
jgi:hypothetical protein